MRYSTLGRTGLVVSRLAFGAMAFGDANYRGFRSDTGQDEANTMVDAAIDAGINLFDTADIYANGESEEILGRALSRSGKREEVILATKVGNPMGEDPNAAGLSYRHIIQSCEGSLRRLGTDWIDLYQLHTADVTVDLDDTLGALGDLVTRGLIRYAGWSNWPAWLAAEAGARQKERGIARFVSAQVYYSLVGRDLEHEILPYATHANLGILVWSPLAGGFLSGKYTRDDPSGGQGRRADFSFPPVNLDRGYRIVEALQKIASTHEATPAQIALAWLLSREGVSSVILGAKRLDQLASNLAASELQLTGDELTALDDVSAIDTPYPWHRHLHRD